jgi:hypothetical protein
LTGELSGELKAESSECRAQSSIEIDPLPGVVGVGKKGAGFSTERKRQKIKVKYR